MIVRAGRCRHGASEWWIDERGIEERGTGELDASEWTKISESACTRKLSSRKARPSNQTSMSHQQSWEIKFEHEIEVNLCARSREKVKYNNRQVVVVKEGEKRRGNNSVEGLLIYNKNESNILKDTHWKMIPVQKSIKTHANNNKVV